MLAHWENSPRMEMLPHLDTFSWFRAKQSLLFLRNAAVKQQIPILEFLAWRDRGTNPWSTSLWSFELMLAFSYNTYLQQYSLYVYPQQLEQ